MKIKKLQLKNYAQFDNKTIEFKDGFNVIFGLNEAGKSSISKAILDCLYVSPNKKPTNEIKGMRKWNSLNLPIIQMEFEEDRNIYYLEKDFVSATSKINIVYIDGKREEVVGIKDVEEVLKDILPFPTRDIYTNSAFITSDNISRIHDKENSFRKSLENSIVSGGKNIDIYEINKQLEKENKDLRTGLDRASTKSGEIKRLKEYIDDLENNVIPHMEGELKVFNDNRSKLIKINEELAELEAFINDKQIVIDKNEEIKKLEGERKQLVNLYNVNDKNLEVLTKAEERLAGLEQKKEKLESSKYIVGSNKRVNMFLLIFALICLFVGLYFVFNKEIYGWIGVGLGLVLGAFSVLIKQNSKTENPEYIRLEGEIREARRNLRFGLEDNSIDNLEAKRRDLSVQIQIKKDNLDVLEGFRIDGERFASLNKELEDKKDRYKELEVDRIELNAIVSKSTINKEDINMVYEDLEISSQKLETLENIVEVNKLIIDGLQYAVKNTASMVSSVVENNINKFLPELTNGRYLKSRSNDDLSIDVFSKEKNEWIACNTNTTELSRGTIDQIYLLARIAYISVLSVENLAVIIMDDPLLTFDEFRKNNAIKILKEIANSGNQILFFTLDRNIPEDVNLS